jgi:hypothetical protein
VIGSNTVLVVKGVAILLLVDLLLVAILLVAVVGNGNGNVNDESSKTGAVGW